MKTELMRHLRATALWPVVFLLLGGATQGIAFVTLVPIIRGLFEPGMPIAWSWVGVLLGVTVVHAALHHSSIPMGNRLGTGMGAALHRLVADRAASAPAASLDPTYSDQLASLDGLAVVVLMGLPGHVLRPLVAAVVTPLTVIVVMSFTQPALAGALAVGAVVLVVAAIVLVRSAAAKPDADGAEWLRRAFQPIRVWPRSPSGAVVGEAVLRRIPALAICAAVATCVALFVGGHVSAGTAVAFVVLSVLTFQPTIEAVLLSSTVLKALEVLARIGRLIDVAGDNPPVGAWPDSTDVQFAGVGVTLGSTPVLTDATFAVAAGTTVSVVGAPDGTRRLLGDLLSGALRPTTGRVLIGGVDVNTIAAEELERHLCEVTAREATVDDVRTVLDQVASTGSVPPCVRAAADRLRVTSPDGAQLSEGDRWRFALLRGWVGDSTVAVVDTTGTGVFGHDSDLADLLAEFVDGRTCLLVAATETAVPAGADEVVVNGGRISLKLLTSRLE